MSRADWRARARTWLALGYRLGRRASGRLARLPRRGREVVDRFDTWAYLDDLAATVSNRFAAAGVDHLVLDPDSSAMPRIAVARPDAARAVRALAGEATLWTAPLSHGLAGRPRPVARAGHGGDGLIVSRNLVSPSGTALTHGELGVTVEFWKPLLSPAARPGGSEVPAGTLVAPGHNGVLDYLDAAQWQAAQRAGHRLPTPDPHLLVLNEPVDLVYTWVDGDDPEWRARKAAALDPGALAGYSSDADIEARFADRQELRYSLRSVAMFASWARRIWIVTDRQVPAWLRQDDRLRVVDHREIFTDPDALPVFNSHAIESQLHHIDGLAERYLYLNDDMLFGAPVRPEQFFHGNGISKLFTSHALIDPAPRSDDDIAVTAAAKNNRSLLEASFGRTITSKLWHTPQPHSRSLMEQFEAEHPDIFDAVMRSRLRSVTDYSLTSSLDAYYAVARGRAVPGRLQYGYLDLATSQPWVVLELWLARRDLHCFCINDSGSDDPATRPAKDAALHEFFDAYFPVASPWE